MTETTITATRTVRNGVDTAMSSRVGREER